MQFSRLIFTERFKRSCFFGKLSVKVVYVHVYVQVRVRVRVHVQVYVLKVVLGNSHAKI
jgi:hypothetical protein